MLSDMVSDTKSLFQQSRERLILTYAFLVKAD